MTNQEMQMVLSYIIEKMDPSSQDEIKEILGGDLPDLGEDAFKKGGTALDRCPERIKRRYALSLRHTGQVVQDGKSETDEERRKRMFPHSDRLRVS